MKRMLFIVLSALCLPFPHLAHGKSFFQDGDRIALVGDTLIEREGQYGYWERNLTLQFPDLRLTFRNLGWSADSPQGKSRASFDWNRDAGVWKQRLKEQIAAVKPTVVFLGYGMANSFQGPDGLASFEHQYRDLIRSIREIHQDMRFVLLSPPPHENLGPPWPKGAAHNENLAQYANSIRKIANDNDFIFVPFFHELRSEQGITDNGIHLNARGYLLSTSILETSLGLDPLNLKNERDQEKAELLRKVILKKNELFFHRWRPQNSTYLFLFRKHEQGQNAREIPQFDPLIEQMDARIHRIKQGSLDLARKEASLSLPGPAPDPHPFTPQPLPAFETDPQLEVNLFAQNPLLAKPIQMNFDPDGRLWVVSSSVYPQIEPGQEANDKVLVLEDRDGDGSAETSTVFADGLLIPTGVIPGDDGVYVGHSTELLHFRDTDHDGRADEKRVVLSGFGTEDTHHIVHTLRWGFDGRLYMNQSIYIHTHTETPHGVVRLNSGGTLRLATANLELDIFMKGLVNSWGHHYDRWGQSFATDGAGTPEPGLSGISHVVPGAMYHTYAGARRILGSISPGSYPKFCSLEFIHSKHFPDSWQGNLVTCDFRANRVVRFQIQDKASSFLATEQPLFLRSTNVTFRPIDVKMGPDGALYIADWSNPIIQHGEVDFRDPRRDQVHGRIWRVTAKERPLLNKPDFHSASNTELFELLLSPNAFFKEQSRRVLVERGARILDDLQSWTSDQSTEAARLEALWIHQGLGSVQEVLLKELLRANDARIRAAAVRVLSDWWQEIDAPLDLLARAVNDSHPRVRLEAVRALAGIPSSRSASLVLSALEKPQDTHLEYSIWLSINELSDVWIDAIRSGGWDFRGKENQLVYALKALETSKASRVLALVMEAVDIPEDGSGPWIQIIGEAGTTDQLNLLANRIRENQFQKKPLLDALAALRKAFELRKQQPASLDGLINPLLNHPDPQVRAEAIRLAGTWRVAGGLTQKLFEIIAAPNASPQILEAAFNTLRETGGRQVKEGLQNLTGEAFPFAVRRNAVTTWMALDRSAAAPVAIDLLSEIKSEADALQFWRELLAIKGAAETLTRALPKIGLPSILATTGLRAAREGGRNESELVLALSQGANLDDTTRELTPDEMQSLAQSVVSEGDPAKGEMVYRRQELACTTCHAIGGVGGKVGPDLTSIGASAPVDYLIEALLYPNRKIKEGYHSIVVETADGFEYSGILVRETNEQLFIRNAADQEFAIAKNEIVRRQAGNSLMPSGLIDALNRQERIDLWRFLSELGKSGPYDATQSNVARSWKLLPETIDLAQFGVEKVLKKQWSDNDWWPAYATVDGRLLQEDLKGALEWRAWRNPTGVYAVSMFDVTKAGSQTFSYHGPLKANAWIDKNPINLKAQFQTHLETGTHRVVLHLSKDALPEDLRISSSDVTFIQ